MMRGICGGSSGGNAAVTAAWTRPDGWAVRRIQPELRADAGREPLHSPPHHGASPLDQVLPPCSPPRPALERTRVELVRREPRHRGRTRASRLRLPARRRRRRTLTQSRRRAPPRRPPLALAFRLIDDQLSDGRAWSSRVDPPFLVTRERHRIQKSSARRPARNPKYSSIATASGKPEASASGAWASLPNETARPPSSAHHCGTQDHNRRVFISSARPESAMLRMAARNPSSNTRGSNGPATSLGQVRAA